MEFGSVVGKVLRRWFIYEAFAGRGEYITEGGDRFNQVLSNSILSGIKSQPCTS